LPLKNKKNGDWFWVKASVPFWVSAFLVDQSFPISEIIEVETVFDIEDNSVIWNFRVGDRFCSIQARDNHGRL